MNLNTVAVETRSWLNGLGAAASIACALQCAFLPLLISILPFSVLASILPFINPRFLLGGGLERALLMISGVLAVGGFGWAFLHHGRAYVWLYLISAFALIFLGRMWVENPYQIPFIVAGSLLVAAGHIVNSRLCRPRAVCPSRKSGAAANPAVLTGSSA